MSSTLLKIEFERALALFNADKLQQVVSVCQPFVTQPMFKLLLATTYGKLGCFTDAERLFTELLKQYPTNLDVRLNYALVLKMQQCFAQAKQQLQQAVVISPVYHPALHALAGLYEAEGDSQSALDYYNKALALQPQNSTYAYHVALVLFQQAQYAEAATLLRRINRIDAHQPALTLLCAVCYKLKQTSALRQLAARYESVFNTSAQMLMYSGLVELDEKCYVKAASLLNQAQKLDCSSSFIINANLLYCRYLLQPSTGILADILMLCRQEASAEAYYFAANLLETLGKLDESAEIVQQGLATFSDSESLNLVLAKVLLRKKQLEPAAAILEILRQAKDPEIRLEGAYLQVALFEAQYNYRSAALEIEQVARFVPDLQGANSLLEAVSRAQQDLVQPIAKADGHTRRLIFIIGFPRSGTTLLEQKLAAFKQVKILEETNAVKQFYHKLRQLAADENVVSYCSSLNREQKQQLAEQYIDSLQDYCQISSGDLIVDKMPLNAVYLAPMLLLFPQAKVILMQRHPMDVCISSLKQRMINLFTVEAFAQSYDSYFSLLELFSRQFSDNMLTIKYEQLVTAYAQTFAAVVSHCGLDAAESSQSDSPIMFNTPSYHQVSQPLYTKAVNSYQHYQQLFDFNHPLLLKWCARNGYVE